MIFQRYSVSPKPAPVIGTWMRRPKNKNWLSNQSKLNPVSLLLPLPLAAITTSQYVAPINYTSLLTIIIWSERHPQKRDQKTPQIVCNVVFYQYPLKVVSHIFYSFSKPSSPETESDTPDPAIRVRKPSFGLFKTSPRNEVIYTFGILGPPSEVNSESARRSLQREPFSFPT